MRTSFNSNNPSLILQFSDNSFNPANKTMVCITYQLQLPYNCGKRITIKNFTLKTLNLIFSLSSHLYSGNNILYFESQKHVFQLDAILTHFDYFRFRVSNLLEPWYQFSPANMCSLPLPASLMYPSLCLLPTMWLSSTNRKIKWLPWQLHDVTCAKYVNSSLTYIFFLVGYKMWQFCECCKLCSRHSFYFYKANEGNKVTDS